MKIGYTTAPPRRSTSDVAIGHAAAAAATSAAVSDRKAAAKKTASAARPPTHPQRKPSGAMPQVLAAPHGDETSDAEKKVRDLMLAFFRRPDESRLYSRERALLADLSAVVRELVAERDEARLNLHDLRKQVERAQLSAEALARWEAANNNDNDEMYTVEELEDKPQPTMWQLIAAGYSNDPELADAWNVLQDDPAFVDLHEPAVRSLAAQMRAHLRLDSAE